MEPALAALEAWAPVASLRLSRFAYPAVNAAHIAGIAMLFSAIVPLDLRLIGLWRDVPVRAMARVLAPVSAAGLLLAAGSGAVLFAVSARDYAANPFFFAKLGLVALGTLHALALRAHPLWRDPPRRWSARLAAGGIASLLLWLCAIMAGRMIAFV